MDENPFTCRHPVGSVEYWETGASCQNCGRRWWKWVNPKGYEMYLTEPRYPSSKK